MIKIRHPARTARVLPHHLAHFALLTAVALTLPSAQAEPIEIAAVEHEGPVDFQREILPILRQKCLACHNATDAESDLILETPATILKGGSEGPSAVVGKSGESRVLQVAAHLIEPVMPPEDNDVGAKPLTPAELGLLKMWIDEGAKGEVRDTAEQIQWQSLPSGVNPVYAVAVSPDGALVAAGRANQILLYSPRDGQVVGRLTDESLANAGDGRAASAHLDMVQSLAFHPDGQWIASGGYRTVKLWRRVSPLVGEAVVEIGDAAIARFSKDGELLLLGDQSGKLTIVQVANREVKSSWNLDSAIIAIAISGDKRSLTTVGADKKLRIWDASDSSQLYEMELEADLVDLCWAESTSLVGALGNQVYVWTWDRESRELKTAHQLSGQEQPVTAVVGGGSERVVTAGGDGSIRVWNLETGQQEKQLDHGGVATKLAVTPDGKRCVSGGAETGTKLWNLEDGKLVAELKSDRWLRQNRERTQLAHEVAQRQVANTKKDLEDGEKRKTQEDENLKKVDEARNKAHQDLTTKQEAADKAVAAEATAADALKEAKEQLEAVQKQAADAQEEKAKEDANKLVETSKKIVEGAEKKVAEAKEAAKKANNEKTAAQRTLESSDRSLERAKAAVAKAAETLGPLKEAASGAEERAKASEAEFKSAESAENGFQLQATHLVMVSSGKQVAVARADGAVSLWNVEDGSLAQQISCGEASPLALGATENGQILTVEAAAKLREWSTRERFDLATIIGSPDGKSVLVDRVTALAFSPDGQHLAVGGGEPSREGELKIFSTEDGELIKNIKDAHSDTVFGVAFSPDGRYIASCGADRFMKVFEIESGEVQKTFEGHTHHVLDVSWQADGRVLASAGADKVVKVWDFKNGSQIRTIQGFGKEVTSLQFAGSTNKFFVSCGDQSLYRCNTDGARDGIGKGGDFLYSVSCSLTGSSVAFGGHDSVVRVVNGDGKELVELK